ncbi:MAG TPA: glycoside hydrolase family 16 protein [Polyangiaceae bacterium]|nr:glycoside hydrolase family 16 protein [Polyangiaceae bacterium]
MALAACGRGTAERENASRPAIASDAPGASASTASGFAETGASPAVLVPDETAPDSVVAEDQERDSEQQEFTLAWQDDFDTFDSSRWQLMTHSWDTNLAQFSTGNARVENGVLSLLLTPEPSDLTKPLRGVEMRSLATLTYGKVESRLRFARGSGVVSSLVLLYTPWPADDWNELDIEALGRYSDRVQFNAMVYTGAPTVPPARVSVTPTQYPDLAPLPFDPSADFHVYAVEWTPVEVRFRVDGQVQHTWSTEIARMQLPQNILLTIWASSSADWAGPLGQDALPASADYDWIRVYQYQPAN